MTMLRGWLLDFCYGCLLIAVGPLLCYRAWRKGKYRDGWREKLFGALPVRQSSAPSIWFHAVSVGEVLALEPLVAEFSRGRPPWDVVITTTTSTGYELARQRFADAAVHYFPLDFSWAVKRAVSRIRPSAVALVELELWPNFIEEVCRRNVPIMLLNARLSEKSFRGYRRLPSFLRSSLAKLSLVASQNETYSQRFEELGVPKEVIATTGSVKFDRGLKLVPRLDIETLRAELGLRADEKVLLAGSTHGLEERAILDCWLALKQDFEQLRLILVPRHRERFEDVAALISEEYGLPLLRRSRSKFRDIDASLKERWRQEVGKPTSSRPSPQPSPGGRESINSHEPVILLDTIGELATAWHLAGVGFVGGTLTSRGGQNMLEPAACGVPVVIGPGYRNFRDVVENLLEREAITVVENAGELQEALRQLLSDEKKRRLLVERAKEYVESQRGATMRTMDLVEQLLKDEKTELPKKRAA